MFTSKPSYYGIKYDEKTKMIKYEGEIVLDKKEGKGKLYSKEGFKIFEGMFQNDKKANGFGQKFVN
jgi:hypothetical protein